MNPEIEQLIRENNKMLKSMHRSMVANRIMRVIYWIIIIVIAFVAYTFIKPYLNTLVGAYGMVEEQSATLEELRQEDATSLEDLLKILQE